MARMRAAKCLVSSTLPLGLRGFVSRKPSTRNSARVDDELEARSEAERAWSAPDGQRAFLDTLGQKLSFSTREDWYKIKNQDLVNLKGEWLLNLYDKSAALAVSSIYSDHKFLPWKFVNCQKFFDFRPRENRQKYLDWLVAEMGVNSSAELRLVDFMNNYGNRLLRLYNYSLEEIINSFNPQDGDARSSTHLRHTFKPSFPWDSVENARKLLDSIGAEIGVKGTDLSPWYTSKTAFLKVSKVFEQSQSNFSRYEVLKWVYPEHNWMAWKFPRMPVKYRTLPDDEVIRQCLDFVEKEYKITEPSGWYKISNQTLKDLGMLSVFKPLGGLYRALKQYRPEFQWEEDKFAGFRQFPNIALLRYLKRIWPNQTIIEDYSIGANIIVSYFLPSLKLAIDFQSQKDYSLEDRRGNTEVKLKLDPEKGFIASKSSIDLVTIPFWWDRTLGSLLATLNSQVPRLEETFSPEIDLNSPQVAHAKPIPLVTSLRLYKWRESVK